MRALALAASLAALACTPPRQPPAPPSAPAPSPPPARGAPPPVAPPSAEARSWTFRYAPGTHRYEIQSDATVELQSDTSKQTAPLRTVALVTLAIEAAADSQLTVTGRVDSFAVSRGELIPAPDSAPPPPRERAVYSATITPTGRPLTQRVAGADSCDAAEPFLAAARELIVAVPPALAVGTRWSDSVATTVCRSGIPVTTGTVRDYEVEAAEPFNGRRAVRVRRRDAFTLAGAGAPRGQSVSLTGRGTGTATLYFDPAAGTLLGSLSESETTLTVNTPRAQARFVQRVRQRIEKR